MARIVNSRLVTTADARRLTVEQRRTGERRLARATRRNPLRRVRLACCGWRRDPTAVVGDVLWCERCADVRQVVELAE